MKNRPLKVAWDNCFAQRNQTGTGTYASLLLEQLAQRADISVEVFDGWPNSSPGTSVKRTLYAVGNLAWMHARLPMLLRRSRVDLLHAPAFLAPIACSCPKVVTVHDVSYLLYPSHFAGRWVAYMKSVMPATLRSAAAIICGSENSKRDIVNAYALSPDKVRVIPYGVDHNKFTPDVRIDHAWARSVGIHKDYVLHVGLFSERKNIPLLLRAVARLRAAGKFESYQLVLAGSEVSGIVGPQEIHQTIQDFDLHDIVVLTGHVPNDKLPGLYRQARLLAMPSRYEGFGFPVLESMATGTPVVASNTSSLPEIAGNAAILFPTEDEQALASAMDDVLTNRTLAEELRSKGLARAHEYTWQRAANETVAVYRSIVAE